ncbi:hypothetical protein VTL71DRAFT_11369 [Oculimacula yallundae]|uniref:Cytochrome P450 n=1 Tax=Oculimacula yallundae TaxID=86028 RepID=A0ABR4CPZ4_9HELO
MSSFLLSSFTGLSASAALTTILATILIVSLWLIPREKLDPREPPLAHSKIPLIGHMINLLWHQNTYFTILHKNQPSPITTLLILRQRIYIISSPVLAQLAFRTSKTIDFETIKQHASCKAIAFDQHGYDIVSGPLVPDPVIPNRMASYMSDLHTEMYGALAQGPALYQTNKKILNKLVRGLNGVSGGWEGKLFEWLREVYTTSSAEALYGIENPVKWNPDFVQLVWDFEKDLGLLVLDKYPALTARKGHLARSAVTPQFDKWYSQGLLTNASGFVKGRARCAQKWGFTQNEMAKAEISILFAAVTNTVPNVFYMLCWIYSSPSLVEELREEIKGIVRPGKGEKEMLLDIEGLREKCPLLTACFHESLRLVKTGFSIRTVLEDTMLDTYLLKKGAIVQIPTGVMQADKATWGEDAEVFDPHRWLPGTDAFKSKDARKVQNAAFIPFGGGKNLCPGRHLAFNEIAAFVGAFVYGFDILGRDGGMINVPKMDVNKLGDGSTSPKGDTKVLMRSRKGFEGVEWGFAVGAEEEDG